MSTISPMLIICSIITCIAMPVASSTTLASNSGFSGSFSSGSSSLSGVTSFGAEGTAFLFLFAPMPCYGAWNGTPVERTKGSQ